MQKQTITARDIAVTAVLMALSTACLGLGSFIPGIALVLSFLCAVFVSVLAMQKKWMLSGLLFIGTGLLGFFLMPNKLQILPYLLFFGHYGVWKVALEQKLPKLIPQLLVKLVGYNIALLAGYFFAREVLLGQFLERWPVWVFFVGAQGLFVLYDMAFSSFLRIYQVRLAKYIFKN